MRPPQWLVDLGRRVNLEQFGQRFRVMVDALDPAFSTDPVFAKVEAWQTYQEPATKSLRAFAAGRTDLAESLIREEADTELDVYATFVRKGVRFTRLRLVETPPSAYLRWELLNYVIRSESRYGEEVRIIDVTGTVDRLPNDRYFDFLLFAGAGALVHDYGDDGLQTGGWFVRDLDALARLGGIARSLRERSAPLESIIDRSVAVGRWHS